MGRNNAKKQPPKKEVTGKGRPPIDWNVLYNEWAGSGLPIKDFLDDYGLSLKSSLVRRMTSDWRKGEVLAKKRMERVDQSREPKKTDPSNLWQIVQQWRGDQAGTDYKTANAIRQHINALLSNGVWINTEGKTESKLTPRDLVNLADAASIVQKIQRLSLGMSTDNIGVDRPDDSHVEQNENTDNCPIFLVEVSDNGKFKRARPKQVQ